MFFLVRCAFWLTIVFVTIFSTDQKPETLPQQTAGVTVAAPAKPEDMVVAQALSRSVRDWATGAIEHFWSKAAGSCAAAPSECIGVAERLTEFAKQHPFKEPESAEPAGGLAAEPTAALRPSFPTDVPLPPLRPQIRLLERPRAPRALLRPSFTDWSLRG